MNDERQIAFVFGCSRSGTTALTRLLNLHPEVAIGFERFAKLAKSGQLSPDLFEAGRFADFRPEDSFWGETGWADTPWRQKVLDRYAGARIVGDKLPQLAGQMDQLQRFPGAKVIFIVREPLGVAKSFNTRAMNPRDAWRPERDWRASVTEFNRAMADMAEFVRAGTHETLVVNYNTVFDSPSEHRRLYEFLGVDPALAEAPTAITDYAAKLREDRPLADLVEHLMMTVDFRRFRALIRTGRQQARAFGS